ncbi:hypothetical protein bcgnr5390_10960 [Bacillus luti]|nr:hypothetical protein BC2903_29950 [Bacillus cereus]
MIQVIKNNKVVFESHAEAVAEYVRGEFEKVYGFSPMLENNWRDCMADVSNTDKFLLFVHSDTYDYLSKEEEQLLDSLGIDLDTDSQEPFKTTLGLEFRVFKFKELQFVTTNGTDIGIIADLEKDVIATTHANVMWEDIDEDYGCRNMSLKSIRPMTEGEIKKALRKIKKKYMEYKYFIIQLNDLKELHKYHIKENSYVQQARKDTMYDVETLIMLKAANLIKGCATN